MVRYKVLASLIISALVLLLPKSAIAVNLDMSVNSTYHPGVSYWVRSVNGNGGTTGCDGNSTFMDLAGGQELRIYESNFYTNNSCNRPLTVGNGDYVQILFGTGSTTTGGWLLFLDIPNFDVVDVTPVYGNVNDGNDDLFGGSVYKVLLRSRTSNNPVKLSGNGATYIQSLYNSVSTNRRFRINWYGIVVLSENDTSAESEVADKELEGQDNIENQDTSGGSQGVSDDNYSSLLDIFTGFITAITNVSGGSCTISLNTDFANLGNVDLCTYDPPSYIQIIGSIILILLFVPLSMALIKRILKTIQELQT